MFFLIINAHIRHRLSIFCSSSVVVARREWCLENKCSYSFKSQKVRWRLKVRNWLFVFPSHTVLHKYGTTSGTSCRLSLARRSLASCVHPCVHYFTIIISYKYLLLLLLVQQPTTITVQASKQ